MLNAWCSKKIFCNLNSQVVGISASILNGSNARNVTHNFIGLYDQVCKCLRWMPWQLEAMKDVGTCDKLRGAGKQALIRRSLNGETHLSLRMYLFADSFQQAKYLLSEGYLYLNP